MLAGLAIGVAFKQHHELEMPKRLSSSISRALFGNIGLMLMFEGIAFITPDRPLALYTTLRFMKYALVPVYIIHIGPMFFTSLGI